MRINIYSEEITEEVQLIQKDNVIGEDGLPVTFYGVRIFLLTSSVMHHNEHDDDRNAITFWFRTEEDRCKLGRTLSESIMCVTSVKGF